MARENGLFRLDEAHKLYCPSENLPHRPVDISHPTGGHLLLSMDDLQVLRARGM